MKKHSGHRLKFFGLMGVILLFAGFTLIPMMASATTPTFTEYSTTTPIDRPMDIITGPDGYLWFAQDYNVGKIHPTTGVVTDYTVPATGPPTTYSQGPTGIIVGPDQNMWFLNGFTRKICKMTTSGVLTEYPLPSYMLLPNSMVVGPDGNFWVTAYSGDRVAKIDTSGTVLASYIVSGGPEGVSVGPDGNIWFAIQNAYQIGRINPSTGVLTTYNASYAVFDTAPGPDGNVWFTVANGKVGKVNPTTGTVAEYNVPVSGTPINVTPGPDGKMWFTIQYHGIAKIDPSTSAITAYETPSKSMGASWGITKGPDNKMWYTVPNNNSKIGRADIGVAPPANYSPPGTSTPSPTPTPDASPTPTPTPTIPPVLDKMTLVVEQNGRTLATVQVGIDLSKKNYDVPDKQVLVVDGALGIVEVRNGASIKGTGKVGKLTVAKGATLAPGHSPGCLASGNLTLSGTYEFEIGGTTACSEYDQVNVTGTVSISGNLNPSLVNDFSPTVGQTFVIISNDAEDAVAGTFSGLAEAATIEVSGITYQISYKGGDGNDVELSVTQKEAVQPDKVAITAKNVSDNQTQTNTKSRLPLYVGAGIAAVVLLGAATAFIVIKRRAKAPGTNGIDTPAGPSETGTPTGQQG